MSYNLKTINFVKQKRAVFKCQYAFLCLSGRHSNEVRAANQLGVKFEFLQIWASTEREHVPCHSMDAYILVNIIFKEQWVSKKDFKMYLLKVY